MNKKQEEAYYFKDVILPLMNDLKRKDCDSLEVDNRKRILEIPYLWRYPLLEIEAVALTVFFHHIDYRLNHAMGGIILNIERNHIPLFLSFRISDNENDLWKYRRTAVLICRTGIYE